MSRGLLIALVVILVLSVVVGVLLLRERRRAVAVAPAKKSRILFPFIGDTLSQRAFEAAMRIARAYGGTIVPAYLAMVPFNLDLDSPMPRECAEAMPLLEAIEVQAGTQGIPVDSRIERGRNVRHAMQQLLDHERFDRIVVTAASDGTDGFSVEDVSWLLDNAPGEIVVVRPTSTAKVKVARTARLGDAKTLSP